MPRQKKSPRRSPKEETVAHLTAAHAKSSGGTLDETVELLELLERHKRDYRATYFVPQKYQAEFFDLGEKYRERMLQAGNRVGKTEAGAYEVTCHLTGEYPSWWKGHRFEHPVVCWVAGVTSLAVRDVIQTRLCGPYGLPEALGTGMIPKSAFKEKPSLARGITDAYDTAFVYHRSNGEIDGVSTLSFKSYEQGAGKFVGGTVDLGWADEPPPEDVYGEFLTRIRPGGRMIITATPLQHVWVANRFLEPHSDRAVVYAGLDDCTFYTEEEKQRILESYLPHERDARRKGLPILGTGAVFPIDESLIKCDPIFPIPSYWRKLWAVDFGISHPFGAVLLAHDADRDIIYVVHCIRMKDAMPMQHAEAMKNVCASAPVAWPHDGHIRDKGSGIPLAQIYKSYGLNMLPTHATFPDGGISFEGGIMEMYNQMTAQRLRVYNYCTEWFQEFRYYYREKNGNVVKKNDDLLSATRIGVMTIRSARAVEMGSVNRGKHRESFLGDYVDFDLFKV